MSEVGCENEHLREMPCMNEYAPGSPGQWESSAVLYGQHGGGKARAEFAWVSVGKMGGAPKSACACAVRTAAPPGSRQPERRF